jgi:hypothetical protein
MTKNWKRFTAGKKIDIFLIKICNLLIPRPPQRTSKLQEKPAALKRVHPALQNMKFKLFSILARSGSTGVIESGSVLSYTYHLPSSTYLTTSQLKDIWNIGAYGYQTKKYRVLVSVYVLGVYCVNVHYSSYKAKKSKGTGKRE